MALEVQGQFRNQSLRDWHDTDVKGQGLGWYWSYLKTKSCLLEGRVVCLLKGRGDLASMEYGTGPEMTGHERGSIGCVASCPVSGSAQGDTRYKNKADIFH